MLHWFAGAKPADGPSGEHNELTVDIACDAKRPLDPDATGYIEAPETPAPVFAVRAFKHAIFGTPQTVHAKPRRHSNTENGRPREVDARPLRPGMHRPRSSGDAYTMSKQDTEHGLEVPSSPTKGILMTPGTAAAVKKNVTFGVNVLDNEEKRPMKSGLPDDCPGKFPSPRNKASEDSNNRDKSPDKGRGRSKLTEALEQARDDSRKRKSKSGKQTKHEEQDDDHVEYADPQSDSGKYWKNEYDIYRANTQREVRKLITKQKSAKSFAQAKDAQCTELADQLKQEQKKVETLAVKTRELTSQLTDLQDQLRLSQDTEKKHQDEIAMLMRQLGRKDSARSDTLEAVPVGLSGQHETAPRMTREREQAQKDFEQRPAVPPKSAVPLKESKANTLQGQTELQRPSNASQATKVDPVQRPSEPQEPTEKTKAETLKARGRPKPNTDDVQLKSSDDIWAHLDSYQSSSAFVSRSTQRPPASPKSGRAVTCGTNATPLRTLSVNSVMSGHDPVAPRSPESLDVECKSTRDAERSLTKRVAQAEPVQQKPESLQSLQLPLPSSEAKSRAWLFQQQEPVDRKQAEEKPADDLSMAAPVSSPFQPDANSFLSRTAPSGPRAAPESKTKPALPINTKENVSPTAKPQPPEKELHMKPSTMWSSINAPQAAKRTTVRKDGKEVGVDRLEAARARINARGRVAT